MTFVESVKSGFINYSNYRGRASRSEFWYWFLFYLLFGWFIMLGVEGYIILTKSPGLGIATGLYFLLFLCPNVSVSMRRMHDVSRSAWWLLFGMVPLVGQVYVLLWLIKEGDPGENKYGDDPLTVPKDT